MSPELIHTLLALGGLLVGWLARHHGILAGLSSTTPQPAPAIKETELELLKQLQEFLVKQLMEKLTAPKG